MFMAPDGREPEPEGGDEREQEREPAAEPLTSRYPMNSRSSGHVYASVINGPMFRVEGILVWMYHRCEARARRNNNRVVNGFRMETLQQMIRVCYCFEGMSESESQNMLDNVVAMTDLTDDENSPRHQMAMDEKETEIFQAFQAYQVGLDLVRRIRDAENQQSENAEANGTTANAEMNSKSSGSENLPAQLRRYLHIPLEEASDPELWMEIRHGGDENSNRSADDELSNQNESETEN